MRQAVILAGGKGTRLADRLNGRPKPLVDVDGIPLLERQLVLLAEQGIEEVLVLVNHAADQVEAFFESRAAKAPKARLIDDGVPRGTAGAVLAVMPSLSEQFLVVYGDTLFDIDIAAMMQAHTDAKADVTLFLHPNDHPADSDLVEIDPDGHVRGLHGYPHPPGAELRNLVNAAFYICERKALEPWSEANIPLDFAKDLFPAMVAKGQHLHGYVSFEYIKDLGTPKRLDKVEGHLRSGVPIRARRNAAQKVVFVDRDGTLNALRDYVRRPEDLNLLPGVGNAIRRLNEAEYRVVVVTNQPVIARGECDFQTMEAIHARLETQVGAEGGWFDAVQFCPHHPDGGFPGEVAALKGPCACRKPGTGMFEQTADRMNIDIQQSWMIGDSTADAKAGAAFGLRTILLETGEGGRDGKWPEAEPTLRCADLSAAVDHILSVWEKDHDH